MSQAKVDRYKKEKANRKKIMKKEKRLLSWKKLPAAFLVQLLFSGQDILSTIIPRMPVQKPQKPLPLR